MKSLYLLAIILLITSAIFLFRKNSEDKFESYKRSFNKQYTSNEVEQFRRAIFEENLQKIEVHNSSPGISHWKGVNQFTDLTNQEFISIYLGLDVSGINNEASSNYENSGVNIDDIDWEQKGAVTPIKDQGQCGSCWAFSTIGSLETLNFLFGDKNLKAFSEQMLVDCSKAYGNHGCQGGLMLYGFRFVMDKGVCLQDEYKYVAHDQKCKKETGSFKIKHNIQMKKGACDDQAKALQTQTISVGVDASSWQDYSYGIMKNCGDDTMNHGVLLVGLNQTDKFWRIKNSWGTSWGEKGYIRLAYPTNTCGVCNMSGYPLDPYWV